MTAKHGENAKVARKAYRAFAAWRALNGSPVEDPAILVSMLAPWTCIVKSARLSDDFMDMSQRYAARSTKGKWWVVYRKPTRNPHPNLMRDPHPQPIYGLDRAEWAFVHATVKNLTCETNMSA